MNTIGYEEWREYNSKGKLIQQKKSYSDGTWFTSWYEYDNNDNLIYNKDSNGNEEWCEYDKYGNLIRHIVKKKDERADVYVALLEYYKNSKTLKKETVYTYQY